MGEVRGRHTAERRRGGGPPGGDDDQYQNDEAPPSHRPGWRGEGRGGRERGGWIFHCFAPWNILPFVVVVVVYSCSVSGTIRYLSLFNNIAGKVSVVEADKFGERE